MNLSLELKKFINSEHTGSYVEIELPGEIVKRVRKYEAEEDAAPLADDKNDTIINDNIIIEDNTSKQEVCETSDASDTAESDTAGEATAKAAVMDAVVESTAPTEESKKTPPPRKPKSRVVEEIHHERMRIHYLEEGNGEPLILIHTVGQSLYTWRRVFFRLSEHYRVIAIDLPGHGFSGRPYTFGYTIDEQAEVIKRFMDAIGIESAHFMAFSMGCAYLLRLAIDHPERIGRIVLLSPGGVTADMPLSVRMIDSPLLGFIASRLYNLNAVDKILKDAVFDLTVITPDVVQEYYRTASDSESRRAIRQSLQYFDDEKIISELRNLSTDALILIGSEDKWRNAQDIELFHAAMRNSSYALLRNGGHLLHEEKPDRIVSALLEYIPVIMP